MPTHAQARDIITQAFQNVFGRAPSFNERQYAQTVALGESSYGRGWSNNPKKCPIGGCADSHNWGAVIVKPCPGKDIVPDCPPNSFLYRDSFSDGSACWQCFRRYKDDVAGAMHTIRTLYQRRPTVLAAAAAGNARAFSEAMFDTRYFTGIGPTREARIRWHMRGIKRHNDRITKALGEPSALNGAPDSETLKAVGAGAAVAAGLALVVVGIVMAK